MCIILRKHCNPIKIKDLSHKQKLIKNKKTKKFSSNTITYLILLHSKKNNVALGLIFNLKRIL